MLILLNLLTITVYGVENGAVERDAVERDAVAVETGFNTVVVVPNRKYCSYTAQV